MREINVLDIENAVRDLCIKANVVLPESLEKCLECSVEKEKSPTGTEVLSDICRNFKVAKEQNMPVCQDTGMAVIFLEIGQDVHFVGGSLYESINNGVARGYTEGFLRCSVVEDPIERVDTKNNTPAVIHTKIVDGDKVKIDVCPKGFGSENMSSLKMMTPSVSVDDICDFVIESISKAGSNPCPPIVVGVGIGGDFEQCAYLAKKALCRNVSKRNEDEFYADMEKEILEKINALDIGPQGFGGKTTALCVNIETFPTHIAGLPVAVNVGCHVTRHASKEI